MFMVALGFAYCDWNRCIGRTQLSHFCSPFGWMGMEPLWTFFPFGRVNAPEKQQIINCIGMLISVYLSASTFIFRVINPSLGNYFFIPRRRSEMQPTARCSLPILTSILYSLFIRRVTSFEETSLRIKRHRASLYYPEIFYPVRVLPVKTHFAMT